MAPDRMGLRGPPEQLWLPEQGSSITGHTRGPEAPGPPSTLSVTSWGLGRLPCPALCSCRSHRGRACVTSGQPVYTHKAQRSCVLGPQHAGNPARVWDQDSFSMKQSIIVNHKSWITFAKDKLGQKNSGTFRNTTRICLTVETTVRLNKTANRTTLKRNKQKIPRLE